MTTSTICLEILSGTILFYWIGDRWIHHQLDQISTIPIRTELFGSQDSDIEEITVGYTVTTPSEDEDEIIEIQRIQHNESIQPMPMRGMTIVIGGPPDPLLQHFVGRMLGF